VRRLLRSAGVVAVPAGFLLLVLVAMAFLLE
jgi:hypothetical protein